MARKYGKYVEGTTRYDYVSHDKGKTYVLKSDESIKISRGELEKGSALAAGWNSRSERDKARKSGEYQRWYHGSLSRKAKPPYPRDVFEAEYLKVKHSGKIDEKQKDWKNGFDNMQADGPFAQFLVWIGMRDKDATYPVGQTPSKKPR